MNRIVSSIWTRVLLIALVLSAALGWIVYNRMTILKNGREIVLKSEPVDPRDLFRGHYVRLGYAISRLKGDAHLLKGLGHLKRNQTVYVTVKPGADGYWVLDSASTAMPPPQDGKVTLKGRVTYTIFPHGGRVSYGIERYYAPVKKALELEKMTRRVTPEERPLGVIVRVAPDGRAAIAGLMIDGKKVYEEPLF